MLLVWLGIYTALIASAWAFFLIAKIHVYKFRDYSQRITPITRALMTFLMIATIIGYLLVIDWMMNTPTVRTPRPTNQQIVEDASNY